MTDQTENEGAPAGFVPLRIGETAAGNPEASLLVSRADVLDRIVDLAHQARGVEQVEIKAPEGLQGVPQTVPAVVMHGATPTLKPVAEFFEPYRTQPLRRKGTAIVDTLDSFVELVNRQKDEDSAIFATTSLPHVKLTAVLDYNRGPDGEMKHQPRFGQHRIDYPFPLTEEFKAWMAMNGKPFEQMKFAQFLEDHVAELASPTDGETSLYQQQFQVRIANPMELITLSRDLEVYVKAEFKQSARLQSGERAITFKSEHVNSQGDVITIPGLFIISLPAWIDGEPVRIPARLRYRAEGTEVKWYYDLYRADFWLREQVINDAKTASLATELPVFFGKPETAGSPS